MDLLLYFARFTLSAVFLLASLEKLAGFRDFERAVSAYGLLPSTLVRPISRALPWVELACALCVGVGVALIPAALAMSGLLAAFGLAMSINLVRGRKHDCGCGVVGTTKISWWSAGRNAVLFGLAVAIVVKPPTALALAPLSMRSGIDPIGDPLAALVLSTTVVLAVQVGIAAFKSSHNVGKLRTAQRRWTR